MAVFINVSEKLGKENQLEICTNTASSVDVLKWQCQGEVIAGATNGVTLESDSHIKKARNFVKCAKETGSGLVLTPEYSFPYSVLEEIIDNKDNWPEKGKLWCLGSQGDSFSSFKERIERWQKKEGVKVEAMALEELRSIKNFLSPVIYFLKNVTDELCIIPQFKTGPMHDPWNVYEGDGLCEGNIIFVFDLTGDNDSKNRFLSLICSDILHIHPHEIISYVGDDVNITLFHPQLNEEPRHIDFINFRRDFINNSNKCNKRLITLNWAGGSSVRSTKIEFNTPWSAFYQRAKHDIKTLEGNNNFRTLRMKNHKSGLFYTYNEDDRIDIWFSYCEEHCMLFQIFKSDVGNVSSIAAHKYEPIAGFTYSYDSQQDKWVEEHCVCKRDSLSILGPLDPQYSYPLKVCSNNSKTCSNDECVMDKCDFFLGSCFGNFEEGQIICGSNEVTDRITISGDTEINIKRKQKSELFKTLVELLKVGVFPDELSEFKNNHRFEIDEERFPIMHLEKHNLCAIKTENSNMRAIVAITESRVPTEVENLVSILKKQLHSKYRDQVLVYYPSGIGFTCYSDHLKNTKITKGKFCNDTESIT